MLRCMFVYRPVLELYCAPWLTKQVGGQSPRQFDVPAGSLFELLLSAVMLESWSAASRQSACSLTASLPSSSQADWNGGPA